MVKQHLLDYSQLNSGVLQGGCLRPVLFLLYTSGLFEVAANYNHFINLHTHADDTQVYISSKRSSQRLSQQNAVNTLEECIADVRLCLHDTQPSSHQ